MLVPDPDKPYALYKRVVGIGYRVEIVVPALYGPTRWPIDEPCTAVKVDARRITGYNELDLFREFVVELIWKLAAKSGNYSPLVIHRIQTSDSEEPPFLDNATHWSRGPDPWAPMRSWYSRRDGGWEFHTFDLTGLRDSITLGMDESFAAYPTWPSTDIAIMGGYGEGDFVVTPD